jgi:integrase
MASIKPYPYRKGWWRAQVARRGVRASEIFSSKGAAVAWAGRLEDEIMSGVRGEVPNLTVKELLDRYEKQVSEKKKGKRWEVIRLQAIGRDQLARVRLRQLDTPHVAAWQERRLKAVKGASVRRERNLLNNVFEIARKEWKWLRANPFEGVRRPKDGKARDRIASQDELDRLTRRASDAMRRAITAAVETAMRAGEIASNPEIRGRVAKLADSKNGEGREVPLSAAAAEAFKGGINLTAGSISALFADLCREEKIKGLTFHDLKHTAMTRLSKKLDPWELAKMSGNKDMNLILNVYYKHDPHETVKKL